MRLTTDTIAFTTAEAPKWNPINLCSYHLQEAGADAVEEAAFALATAVSTLDACKARGAIPPEEFPKAVGRMSFFRQQRREVSLPKSASCAQWANCGTRSRVIVTASPIRSCACSATACR